MVILDMIMRGMGGGETFEGSKSINPDVKGDPVERVQHKRQGKENYERGCKAFIQKPFQMGDLSDKIKKVLD